MKIEWTEPSLLDIEGIRDYIKKDSEYYANRFVERIIEAVETERILILTVIHGARNLSQKKPRPWDVV